MAIRLRTEIRLHKEVLAPLRSRAIVAPRRALAGPPRSALQIRMPRQTAHSTVTDLVRTVRRRCRASVSRQTRRTTPCLSMQISRTYQVIEATLRQVDQPQLQVAIDATIAEVTLNDQLSYGVQTYLTSHNVGLKPNTGSILNTQAPIPPATTTDLDHRRRVSCRISYKRVYQSGLSRLQFSNWIRNATERYS